MMPLVPLVIIFWKTLIIMIIHSSNQKTKSRLAGVYFCPMECEGEKLYFKQGKCPVCGMYLAPIEEREEIREKAKNTENQKVKFR